MMITTPRLNLRPSTLKDAPFALELVNTPKWLKMIGDRKIYNLEAAEKYLQKAIDVFDDTKGIGQWIITLKDTKEKIGFTGLYKREGLAHFDIGFAIMEKYENKGYTYEATKKLMDHVIQTTGIKRIEAITLEENIPSRKLLEKLGLQFEKIVRLPKDPVDLMLYAIDL